jgi:energy-coupling factor transporter ATP-binding protein EcfA2
MLSTLAVPRLSIPLGWRHSTPPEALSTPLLSFPRGRITEVTGTRSSGRTTLLHSLLATSTSRGESAVLIDATDAFDPSSAAAAGVELAKLIWIRCGGNVEHAMRAADLVIHAGGFGTVALDLAEATPRQLQRIPPTAWFRFRRAVEPTPTVLAVVATQPLTKSCAAVLVRMKRRRAVFTGSRPFELLRGAEYEPQTLRSISLQQAALAQQDAV